MELQVMLQKFHYVRSKKARASAKGEDCTMNGPMCNHDSSTVVLCHSNDSRHGKGTSIKASDEFTFYGCSGCNFWFDDVSAPKELKHQYFWIAWVRTQNLFMEKGLTDVVVDQTRNDVYIEVAA